ncbi:MAG: pentapeptide repeat-containing protein, partial [Aphanizomenon sp.]
GSDKPEVILGGIYTLERIARDSKPDQWTIMEVLTAFVRQNAPIIKENKSQSPEDQEKLLKLRISIRACLTVIGERKYPDLENKYIDLTEVNLSGFNLVGFKLKGFNFTGANLFKANLTEANLTEAVLAGANLTGANLTGANLTGAYLTGADLTGANLRGADLTGANLTGAYRLEPDWITKVLLTEADLEGAILTGATMPDGSIHD